MKKIDSQKEIQGQKQKLRKEIKSKLSGLSTDYIETASAEITASLISMPEFQLAKCVFCYVSMEKEVHTKEIIYKTLKSGKKLVCPLCISDSEMVAVEITEPENDLTPGSYGITEPRSREREIDPTEIDFAVIPCLSAESSGARIGHGRGYYDRYLKKTKNATKVLLCMKKILLDNGTIPMDVNDEYMDFVLTEK